MKKYLVVLTSLFLCVAALLWIFSENSPRKGANQTHTLPPPELFSNTTNEQTVDRQESSTTPLSNHSSRTPHSEPTWRSPTNWNEFELLEETVLDEPNSLRSLKRRIRILTAPDLGFPIRVEEIVDTSGNPQISQPELVSAMAANQLLISSEEPIDERAVQQIADAMDWRTKPTSSPYTALIESRSYDIDTVENAIELLASEDLPFISEPNYLFFTAAFPNDPAFAKSEQWYLEDPIAFDIDARAGWDVRTDASDVVIAIIDTGIRLDHEDLIDNLWTNSGEIPGNGIDDDNNGYVDDYHGYNTLDTNLSPNDDNGHGTHVAGTAGARGNNGKGITGVAWDVNLMAVKGLSSSGVGSSQSLADAIHYAIDAGADVINASWGGTMVSQALFTAVGRTHQNDIILVAAAGNAGREFAYFPAGSRQPNVISVGASDRSGDSAYFSNYGWRYVDVFAPGTEILSAWHESPTAYRSLNGTSMATPIVAGLVALNIAQFPEDETEKQIRRIMASVKVRPELQEFARSSGIININTGLNMVRPPELPFITDTSDTEVTILEGENAQFSVTAESDIEITYQWYFGDSPLSGETSNTLNLESVPAAQAGTYRVGVSNMDGSVWGTFELIVYPRMHNFETAVGANFPIYASNPDYWRVANEGNRQYLTIESLRHRTTAELVFEIPYTGLGSFEFNIHANALANLSFPFHFNHNEPTPPPGIWTKRQYYLWDNEQNYIHLSYRNPSYDQESQPGIVSIDNLYLYPRAEMPPFITSHPASRDESAGLDVSFHATAEGEGLSYQWVKDGAPIEGATSNLFEIQALNSEDAGDYQVIVSNIHGQTTSNIAELSVNDNPIWPRFLDDSDTTLSYLEGEPVALVREAIGTSPLSYQWYFAGNAIPTATEPTLRIDRLSIAHSGTYDLVATNDLGSATTSITLAVRNNERVRPPDFPDTDSVEQRFVESGSGPVILEFDQPGGTAPLEIALLKDGEPVELTPVTSPAILQRVASEDSGSYRMVASNQAGTDYSRTIELTVLPGPETAVEFEEFSLRTNQSSWATESFVRWTDVESHDGEDSIQLYHDGVSESSPSLTLVGFNESFSLGFYYKSAAPDSTPLLLERENLPTIELPYAADWTKYKVHIPEGSNYLHFKLESEGEESSAWIDEFSFVEEPVVYKEIAHDAPVLGWPCNLSAGIGGSDLSYQWYKDGQAVAGANTDSLHIPTFSEVDQGTYHLEASNTHGIASTATIELSNIDNISDAFDTDLNLTVQSTTDLDLSKQDPNSGYIIVSSTFEDSETILFEAQVEGPKTLTLDYLANTSLSEVTIGDTAYSIENSTTRSVSAFFIPKGSQPVEMRFEASNENHHFSLYALKLSDETVIIDQATTYDPLQNSGDPQDAPFVSIAGNAPFTLAWKKDGQAFLSQIDIPSGSHYLFDRELTQADSGTYNCEIIDAEGNTVSSTNMEVRNIDSLSQVIDSSNAYMWGSYQNLEYSFEEFVTGNSSLSVNGPFPTDGQVITIRGRDFYKAHLKATGFQQDALFEISVDEQNESNQRISLNPDWQAFQLAAHNAEFFQLTIPQSANPDARVYIDGFEAFRGMYFRRTPPQAKVYFGARLILAAEAVSTLNDPISYQWYLNGSPIAHATDSVLTLPSIQPADLGDYHVVAYQENGFTKRSPAGTVALLDEDFGTAIGAPNAKIMTYGDSLWRIDESTAFEGTSSLRSGEVSNEQNSYLRIEVDGTTAWNFYRKYVSDIETEWHLNPWPRLSTRESPASTILSAHGGQNETIVWVDKLTLAHFNRDSFDDWSDRLLNNDAATISSDDVQIESDPDADSIPNWVEYALGLDPASPDQLPSFGQFHHTDGSFHALLKIRHTQNPDYQLGFQVSTDLKSWHRADADITLVDSDGIYDQIEASLKIRPHPNQPVFYRWVLFNHSSETEDPSAYTFGN